MLSLTMAKAADGELRGHAALVMAAEDARWCADVILTARRSSATQELLPLLLGHHFVRVIYEGTRALRSPDPHVGRPDLAARVRDQFATATAQARHASKLFDDTQKTRIQVLAEFDSLLAESHQHFTGNAPWWARRLESDLVLYRCQDRLVGASVPSAYRLGVRIPGTPSIGGEDLNAVTREWGNALAVLSGAAGSSKSPTTAASYVGSLALTSGNHLASRYFRRRFDDFFPTSLKAVLLLIEGDMNTALTVLPRTADGHQLPSFRARTISLYHCLRALQRTTDDYPTADTTGLRGLRALLADAPTQRLLTKGGKRVRNRCTHYPVSDPTIRIDSSLPMFGIIESVYAGNTWERFDADVAAVTHRVADQLGSWRPTRRRR